MRCMQRLRKYLDYLVQQGRRVSKVLRVPKVVFLQVHNKGR
jgi:hypothetical protein